MPRTIGISTLALAVLLSSLSAPALAAQPGKPLRSLKAGSEILGADETVERVSSTGVVGRYQVRVERRSGVKDYGVELPAQWDPPRTEVFTVNAAGKRIK